MLALSETWTAKIDERHQRVIFIFSWTKWCRSMKLLVQTCISTPSTPSLKKPHPPPSQPLLVTILCYVFSEFIAKSYIEGCRPEWSPKCSCTTESIACSSAWCSCNSRFSALLAFCAGNSLVNDEFPSQKPLTWSFDVFFDLRLNQQLSKQERRRWFGTSSRPLWQHCNDRASYILFSIGLGNALLLVPCQEITWNDDDFLSIGSWGKNFIKILSDCKKREMHMKMCSPKVSQFVRACLNSYKKWQLIVASETHNNVYVNE